MHAVYWLYCQARSWKTQVQISIVSWHLFISFTTTYPSQQEPNAALNCSLLLHFILRITYEVVWDGPKTTQQSSMADWEIWICLGLPDFSLILDRYTILTCWACYSLSRSQPNLLCRVVTKVKCCFCAPSLNSLIFSCPFLTPWQCNYILWNMTRAINMPLLLNCILI